MNVTALRPRVGTLAALVVAVAALLMTASAPSRADFPGQTTDGNQGGRVGRCYASAGPSYLGLRCITARGATVDRKTPSEILCHQGQPRPAEPPPKPAKVSDQGDPGTPDSGPRPPQGQACDPVPVCWYIKLNTQEQAVLGKTSVEEPGGQVFYWYRCLYGIDANRNETGAKIITQEPRFLDFEDQPKKLMGTQEKLVDYFFQGDENDRVPQLPVLAASPNIAPRVNTDVSFFDNRSLEPSDRPGQTNGVVSVQAGDVRLMAVEDYADVSPTGDPDPTFRCDRQGATNPNAAGFDEKATVGLQATEDTTRANTPNACWYTFKRSSADEQDSVYHARMTAHWSVWSKDGGGAWEPFAPNGKQVQFTKSPPGPFSLAVSEVQAVNVLPDGVLS